MSYIAHPQREQLKYAYDVDLAGNNAGAFVLQLVSGANRVLELGAGAGSITRLLKDVLNARVTALEIDAPSAEYLATFCERVVRADLNAADWAKNFDGSEPFDSIVIADVLEHLLDPLATLRAAAKLVHPAGSLVISLPHIGHSSVLACLMLGDFEYREWGLLDKTHLRFFAIKNIQDLIESAGLKIVDVRFVVRHPRKTEFAGKWKQLPRTQRHYLAYNKHGNVYQIVLKAVGRDGPGKALDLASVPVPKPESRRRRWLFKAARPKAGEAQPRAAHAVPARADQRPQPVPAAAPRSGEPAKLIAFYLPQYYPFEENDRWWGKGFTDWRNVTKATPLFAGHYQPHLPADLGYYDLRVRDTRHEQIKLAKAFGIDAFCYHYYWFSGKRLLDAPIEDMLADPASDMPFCLNWANENWTRRWDASEREILIRQEYRPDDDLRLIDDVCRFFADPRYVRIGGAPLFLVYRPQQLPDCGRSADVWRKRAHENGFPNIHLCCALTHGNREVLRGFDSGVEFPPHNLGRIGIASHKPLAGGEPIRTYDYRDVATSYIARSYDRQVFRTVFPSWDNTARMGTRATIVAGSSPHNYEHWLGHAVALAATADDPDKRIVFINAWNEWAEGCHLEPDLRHGHAFLEATRRVRSGTSTAHAFAADGAYRPLPFRKVTRMSKELVRLGRQLRRFRRKVDMRDMRIG